MAGGHRHGQGVREIFFRVVVVLHVRERERGGMGLFNFSMGHIDLSASVK